MFIVYHSVPDSCYVHPVLGDGHAYIDMNYQCVHPVYGMTVMSDVEDELGSPRIHADKKLTKNQQFFHFDSIIIEIYFWISSLRFSWVKEGRGGHINIYLYIYIECLGLGNEQKYLDTQIISNYWRILTLPSERCWASKPSISFWRSHDSQRA